MPDPTEKPPAPRMQGEPPEPRAHGEPFPAHDPRQIGQRLRLSARGADLRAPLPAWLARLTGAVLSVFGLLLATLLLWFVTPHRGKWRMVPETLTIAFILGLITAWCLYAAWRLLRGRRETRGSLLAQKGWTLLAALIGGVAGALVLALIYRMVVAWGLRGDRLVMIAFLLCLAALFCHGCLRAARAAALTAREDDPAYDAAADRLRAPRRFEDVADPQAWVLVHNDDASPMEFVVHTFAEVFGIDRNEALVLMLRIHHKGSACLPCESLAQAQDFGAQLAARAKEAGHPLACEVRQERPEEA